MMWIKNVIQLLNENIYKTLLKWPAVVVSIFKKNSWFFFHFYLELLRAIVEAHLWLQSHTLLNPVKMVSKLILSFVV